MSWQAYVDTSLLATGHVSQAGIYGLDNASAWAVSKGFAPKPEEVKKIIAAFRDPTAVQAGGFTIAGTKYLYQRSDDRRVYGKKGATGAICVKSGKALIVGMYNDKIQPGQCANVVERLADYLVQSNY